MTEPASNLEDAARVTAGGERVTHLWPNDCYYAHLSIYYFALPLVQDALVLDAGSGAGYGAAYLAEHGARHVEAVDVSEEAVAFSQKYFQRPNLRYQAMSLEELSGFSPASFNVIFSSNVLEHVPNVLNFFKTAHHLLKPGGTLVAAVPPIFDETSKKANVDNLYHLNIWSPRQWHHVLSMFYEEVECYQHRFDQPGKTLDFWNQPEQTTIREQDFSFPAVPLEGLYEPTLTAVFIARKPKAALPSLKLDFVDDSYTRPPSATPPPPPPASTSPARLLRRAGEVARQYGLRGLISQSCHYLARRLRKG